MLRRIIRSLTALIGLASAGYFLAFKNGQLAAEPTLFAALVGAVCLGLAIELGWSTREMLSGRDRTPVAVGRWLCAAGLLIVGAGGFANWLLSLQGFMILSEGEFERLFHGETLTEFHAGPLSDPGEMDVTIALREVELRPGSSGTFFPESTLEVVRGVEEPTLLTLVGPRRAPFGSLWFHGGAFGYSPKIVILRDGRELFNRWVPFLTRLRSDSGISFGQTFSVTEHDLKVAATILLESLDEDLRGHPTLALELTHGDEVLGAGSLLPGHFAELDGGFRIGFAGLKKWQEIDISRRNYPEPMLAGAVATAIGGLVWAVGRLRRIRA